MKGMLKNSNPNFSAAAFIKAWLGWSGPPSPSGRLQIIVLNPSDAICSKSEMAICGAVANAGVWEVI